MRTITRTEWQSYCRHGYASVTNGQRFVLALEKATGATILEPIAVAGVDSTRPAWGVTTADELKAEIAGRRAAAAYLAGDSLG
jgi:hypothetical protein